MSPQRGSAVLGVAVAAVLLGLLVGIRYAGRVPQPDITLPAGDQVVTATGTCWEGGSEYFMCAGSQGGVRSLLTVRTERSRAEGEPLLRAAMEQDGYTDTSQGLDTKGFSTHGVKVERAISYCRPKADCVALVNWVGDREYVLAWVRR